MSRRIFQVSLAVLVVCLVAVASPAGAKFGNPIKKAKEKLQKATGQQVEGQREGDDVVFDNVVVELTGERVDKIVAAFQKASAEGTARRELVDQYNAKNTEQTETLNKNEEAIRNLRNKRSDVETCYQDGLKKITERKAMALAENLANLSDGRLDLIGGVGGNEDVVQVGKADEMRHVGELNE